MDHNLKENVVITGGSEGIGLSIAELLLDTAKTVTLIGRNQSKLDKAKTHLNNNEKVNLISLDVTDFEKVKNTLSGFEVNALINCAGFAKPGYFHEQDVNGCRALLSRQNLI